MFGGLFVWSLDLIDLFASCLMLITFGYYDLGFGFLVWIWLVGLYIVGCGFATCGLFVFSVVLLFEDVVGFEFGFAELV